jgi:hypothetical protein
MKKSLAVSFLAFLFLGNSLLAKDTERGRVERFLPKVQALRSIADEILEQFDMDEISLSGVCSQAIVHSQIQSRSGRSGGNKKNYRSLQKEGTEFYFPDGWVRKYLSPTGAYAVMLEQLGLPALKGVKFDYSEDFIKATWGLELEQIALEFDLLEFKSALERFDSDEMAYFLQRLYKKRQDYQRQPLVVRRYLDRDFHLAEIDRNGLRSYPYGEIPVVGKRFHAWASGEEFEGIVTRISPAIVFYKTDGGGAAEFSSNGRGMLPREIPVVIRGY